MSSLAGEPRTMPDLPPQNRAQRRAQAKGKTPTTGKSPVFLRRTALKKSSPNALPSPATSTGAASDEDDPMAAQPEPGPETVSQPDIAPTRGRQPATASHKKGAGKQELVRQRLTGYYALVGMIVSRVSVDDGMIVMEHAGQAADAWIEVGKVNPRVMRALEAITLYGPYVELAMVHVDAGMAIMKRRGHNPLDLLNPLAPTGATRTDSPSAASPGFTSTSPSAAPLPYVPVGATAPTESMPPPLVPQVDSDIVVFPDEGLPGDVDVQLRQMARMTGRPYEELRQEAVVAIAQMRMEANGNSHTRQAGALGAPIAKE